MRASVQADVDRVRLLRLVLVAAAMWMMQLPKVPAEQPGKSREQPPARTALGAEAAGGSAPLLDGREGRELSLRLFRPQPQLRVEQHLLRQAKFPVVDVHTHFRVRFHESPELLEQFVRVMDRHQIALCISLDAELGPALEEHLNYLARFPHRFLVFVHLDWMGDGKPDDPSTWACQRPGFAERTALQLAAARERQVRGLKLFKQFGLQYRNPDGSLIAIDDPRWDPIWQACGELGLPVIMHTADPDAFFQPIDERNERWEELSRHPDWSFADPMFPRKADLLAARNRVLARHPRTTFIGAHMAASSEDLGQLAQWLEQYPNLYVEPASRISELGRQPYTARKFFLQYADRILFGTDGPWPEARLTSYWRFLETFDEYFPYSEKEFPPQGLWQIYGIGLPDEVLRKVYYENAERLIPGVKEALAAQRRK